MNIASGLRGRVAHLMKKLMPPIRFMVVYTADPRAGEMPAEDIIPMREGGDIRDFLTDEQRAALRAGAKLMHVRYIATDAFGNPWPADDLHNWPGLRPPRGAESGQD